VPFEIPVIQAVLVRTGLLSVEKLRDARPYVILGAFVVSAVVTPPDVLSQFMLAMPMCLLYEGGLIFSRFFARSKSVPQDSADPAR
jgi:sec-independent protein translocase protein TatC